MKKIEDILSKQKPNKCERYRNWMITYNYKKEEFDHNKFLKARIKEVKDVVYYVFQLERGGIANKLHHHLFIRCKHPKTYDQIGKIFYNAHIKHISTTPWEVISYCTKERTRVDGPYEWGDLAGQGRRSDLADIVYMIDNDYSDDDIKEFYPSHSFLYHQHISVMRDRHKEKVRGGKYIQPNVTYIYGKTGTGKTRSVYETHDYKDVYRVTNYVHPFDGYKGEKVIVFEEYKSNIPLNEMLSYLDGYFLRLPARYHDKAAMYTEVYIISNDPFEKVYPNVQQNNLETYEAFCRRITGGIKEYSLDNKGEPSVRIFKSPKEYYKEKKRDIMIDQINKYNEGEVVNTAFQIEKDWFDDDDYLDFYNVGKLMNPEKHRENQNIYLNEIKIEDFLVE